MIIPSESLKNEYPDTDSHVSEITPSALQQHPSGFAGLVWQQTANYSH